MKKFLLLILGSIQLCLSCAPFAADAQNHKSAKKGVWLQTPEPKTPTEHNNRGVELGSKGLWQDALREHEEALRMDPHHRMWRVNLSAAHLACGKSLEKSGQNEAAASQFRKALIIDPANVTADIELDKIIDTQKHNSNDYEYRKQLAEDAEAKQDYDTAIVERRKCTKLSDSGLAQALLGKTLIAAGKDVEGYTELRAAVGRSGWPEDQKIELAGCHRALAELLKGYSIKALSAGNRETGLKRLNNCAIEFRRAIALNPSDARAIQGLTDVALEAVSLNGSFDNHLLLFGAYLLGADFAHAKQELEFCLKADPKRTHELDQAWSSLYRAMARSLLT